MALLPTITERGFDIRLDKRKCQNMILNYAILLV